MLSIFVMYSNDRQDAFLYMLEILKKMPLFEESQKILIVDGTLERYYPGWSFVEVPRIDGEFCWGRMWDAGVLNAKHDKIVYLDSDRLLPRKFLKLVSDNIQDNTFVFTSQHFIMHKVMDIDECVKLLEADDYFTNPNFGTCLFYDPRFQDPVHGPAKYVMSGSTGFTKHTYLSLGGVDQWYCGHGAYADSDFHYQALLAGCKFVDLGLIELHYQHEKRDASNKALSAQDLRMLSLDNFIYYLSKWNLPVTLAENVALKMNVKDPKKLVAEKLRLFRESVINE